MNEDGKNNQKKRSRKAVLILNKHYDRYDHRACVVDMLTDLRHFCDVKGIDFFDAGRSAYSHYLAEKGGEEKL